MNSNSEKSEARLAAELLQRSIADGSIADADMVDVSDLASTAALAPERFGGDLAAAAAYHEGVMAHYFAADFSRYVRDAQLQADGETSEREESYLAALAAASDQTPDEMNWTLARADAGLLSGLRKAEEAFFYG